MANQPIILSVSLFLSRLGDDPNPRNYGNCLFVFSGKQSAVEEILWDKVRETGGVGASLSHPQKTQLVDLALSVLRAAKDTNRLLWLGPVGKWPRLKYFRLWLWLLRHSYLVNFKMDPGLEYTYNTPHVTNCIIASGASLEVVGRQ